VRRARRRFWDPGGTGGAETRAAFLTLHECLTTLAQLLAPFTPFLAEELWRNLAARSVGVDSVHLTDYPVGDRALVDAELDAAMDAARQVVELGRRIRTETRVRVRQPLLEAVVHLPGGHDALRTLLPLVAEELNVKEVRFAESAEAFGRWRAKPNFRALGPRLGPGVQQVAAALAADDGSLAAALARGETVSVDDVTLEPDDVDLVQETLEGWGVAAESGITVALELELTPDLRREGLARELVRLVQDARKAAGLEVSDRILLGVETHGELAEAIAAHGDQVAGETLARELSPTAVTGATYRQDAVIEGSAVTITLRRA
jgi:isoleucyl-tRNA synthetase